MPISDWPKIIRPREKLLKDGAENLSDAELLAIFIHSGTKGKTALDLAYSMLEKFGGIRNLFDATKEEICASPGIGEVKYVELQAILEISRRYLSEQLINTKVIASAETAYFYLVSKLRNYQREVFACLFLNKLNNVIHYEELFYGTIDHLEVYPREIAKIALKYNASALILAHNHPSGSATPSEEDKKLTKALIKDLKPLEIKILDHIIIGKNNYISLLD